MHEWNSSHFQANEERFCDNSDGNAPYPEFVRNRRNCHAYCARDCTEESYNLVTDTSSLPHDTAPTNPDDPLPNPLANVSESVIIIWPDRKMYEMVQHNKEIDFFELIGCLGGHAHIWLGISAIQLYDVFYKVVQKVKFCWKKFVYCS